jgi:transcriptional regulator with XRE-family HTH domain
VAGKLDPQTREGLAQLGEHIRLLRRERGISRRKLAESLGMHVANYAKIEQGKKNVTFDTLWRVANGLGLELSIELVAPANAERGKKSRQGAQRRAPKRS